MTRFHRLELDQQQLQAANTTPLQQRQEGDHDEKHWMREADQNRRQGQYEEALRFYSRALEMDRSLVAGWLGQVQMLILLDEAVEAELWSRKAIELFKGNGDLMAGRAQALCRNGDLKQAQGVCDSAMGQQDQSAYRWTVRGELMLARRDTMEQYCFDKAVQMDADWLVVLEIALIYVHYGVLAKALGRLHTAVEKAPDHAHCWYQQGLCEVGMGLTRPARQSFGRCLELAPKHLEARRRLLEMDCSGWSVQSVFRRLFRRS